MTNRTPKSAPSLLDASVIDEKRRLALGWKTAARDLSDSVGETVGVREVVLPSEPMSAAVGNGDAWLAQLAPMLDTVALYDGLFACVGVPPPVAPSAIRSEVLAAAARVPTTACPPCPCTPTDAIDASPVSSVTVDTPDAAHD